MLAEYACYPVLSRLARPAPPVPGTRLTGDVTPVLQLQFGDSADLAVGEDSVVAEP